jgi:hypothetical protein
MSLLLSSFPCAPYKATGTAEHTSQFPVIGLEWRGNETENCRQSRRDTQFRKYSRFRINTSGCHSGFATPRHVTSLHSNEVTLKLERVEIFNPKLATIWEGCGPSRKVDFLWKTEGGSRLGLAPNTVRPWDAPHETEALDISQFIEYERLSLTGRWDHGIRIPRNFQVMLLLFQGSAVTTLKVSLRYRFYTGVLRMILVSSFFSWKTKTASLKKSWQITEDRFREE